MKLHYKKKNASAKEGFVITNSIFLSHLVIHSRAAIKTLNAIIKFLVRCNFVAVVLPRLAMIRINMDEFIVPFLYSPLAIKEKKEALV